MRNQLLLLIVSLFLCVSVNGQQHLFLDGQLDYGYLFRSISSKGDVLKSSSLGSELNVRAGLSYRIFNRLQVGGGIGVNRQGLQLKDKDFESRNEGFEVPIDINSIYTNYYSFIKYSHRIDRGLYAYGQVGYDMNKIKSGDLSASDSYVIGFEELNVTTNYIDETTAITPEVGIESFVRNGDMWGMGLKYTMFADDMMTGTYAVTGGSGVIASDEFKLSGSNIAFTFHYHLLLWHKEKRERPIRVVREEEKKIEEPVVEEKEPAPVTKTQANDRDYQVTHKVKVHSADLRIEVWDHQKEDGDIVSLILNDEYIIQNYELMNKKKVFYVKVHEGRNNFILYAHNLGMYKPNTASILIYDGDKENVIVLESDLKESGALEIKYVPKKK